MTRAYSMDLRTRVVDAVLSGATVREAAARFGVAVSTTVKWSLRFRATGSLNPQKMGGHRRPARQDAIRDFVLGRIAEKPDLTVRALQAELLERGLKLGHNTVWRRLKAEGLSCKKNRTAKGARSAQDRSFPNALESASAPD